MIREALNGEIPGTGDRGEFRRVVVEEGEVTGYIACSRLDGSPFIHDLAYEGPDPSMVAALVQAARKQVKAWGFDEVFCNVMADNVGLAALLMARGFEPVQVVFKGLV